MTKEHEHGPVSLALQWAQGEEHPWLIACDERASYLHLRDYSRRMWIEELFGDLEDDGFHLNRSRLYEPERLSRLVMALAWVYTWLMHVGAYVTKRGWRRIVDRNDRRDRSLVEIGRHWIRRCMTNDDLLRAGLKPYYRPNCPVASTTSLADGVHGQRPANEAVTEAIIRVCCSTFLARHTSSRGQKPY